MATLAISPMIAPAVNTWTLGRFLEYMRHKRPWAMQEIKHATRLEFKEADSGCYREAFSIDFEDKQIIVKTTLGGRAGHLEHTTHELEAFEYLNTHELKTFFRIHLPVIYLADLERGWIISERYKDSSDEYVQGQLSILCEALSVVFGQYPDKVEYSQNHFVDREQNVKLIDLGLSRCGTKSWSLKKKIGPFYSLNAQS